MKKRFQKWVWKISGAEKLIESKNDEIRKIVQRLNEAEAERNRLETLVQPGCHTGDWCQECEHSYEIKELHASLYGVVDTHNIFKCKLKVPCDAFKEVHPHATP